jgi:hypothetical protein
MILKSPHPYRLSSVTVSLALAPEQREQRYARREKSAYLSRMPACNEVVASTRRHTFQCFDCDRPDPLKSDALGWLSGELGRDE